jgi:hypothetical protein
VTTFYCDTADGADSPPNTVTWWNGDQATYKSLVGSLAAATGAGPHVIYVSHTHAHTYAGTAGIDVATADGRVSIISVNRSTGVRATGAKEMTPNISAINITNATRVQYLSIWGVHFQVNAANNANIIRVGNSSSGTWTLLDSCHLDCQTVSNQPIQIGATSGGSPATIFLLNCLLTTKNNTSAVNVAGCNLYASNLTHAFAGASKSVTLFGSNAGHSWLDVVVANSDLTGFDAGHYFGVGNAQRDFTLRNCKLHATPGLFTGTWAPANTASITLVNTDSADTVGNFAFHTRLGSLTRDTGIYANVGFRHFGEKQSWKIVTTSTCSEHQPFTTPWIMVPSEVISSANHDLHIVHDSATNMHDRNLWSELEYVSNADFPQGTLHRSRNAAPFDGSSVDWAASSEAWTGTGGFGNENKQRLRHTVAPAEKSLVRARLFVGVASKTLYVDPLLRIA